MRYNRDSIDRGLKHWHGLAQLGEVSGSFKYIGQRNDKFVVSMHSERMELSPREAWILCFGLRAGSDIGKAGMRATPVTPN